MHQASNEPVTLNGAVICNVCERFVKPDYFGHVFTTCSDCVADEWVAEFVRLITRKGRNLPVLSIPRGKYGATSDGSNL